MKNKSTSLHLLNRGDTGPFPGSDSCYCARVKQNKRLRGKKRSSHAQLTFPECLKVTSTTAAVHPNPPPPSLLGTAQLSCRFHVSDLCCCCFLLWAEFYTVCQSPERHTLEGPVEWDTKSDPSGERLISHLPPPPLSVCLSLSSSLSLPLSLKPFFFLCIPSSLSPSSSPPPAPSTTPQTPGQVWASQIPSVWRGYATSVGAFSARVVGQAQPTSPSMHHSEHATNEHDWRNVPVPVPCLFVW